MRRRQQALSAVVAAGAGLLLTIVLTLLGGDPGLMTTVSAPTVLGLALCVVILVKWKPDAHTPPDQDGSGASPYRAPPGPAAGEATRASRGSVPLWLRDLVFWVVVVGVALLVLTQILPVLIMGLALRGPG
jgi:hypothetical protein